MHGRRPGTTRAAGQWGWALANWKVRSELPGPAAFTNYGGFIG
jgi:hypothetical protein